MDDTDKKILGLLSQNARMTVKEIAAKVSLTSPAVSDRIHRMEQEGAIAGYTVVLGEKLQPARIDALISISVLPASREEFLQLAQSRPGVTQCFHVTGSHSFILKVTCPDIAALEHLINRLQRYGQTSSQIILSTPVDRRGIPL